MFQRSVVGAALLLLVFSANAQLSLLDPVFGTNGVVRLSVGSTGVDAANDVLPQPDGRILIAGTRGDASLPQMVGVRLLENGAIDSSFSNNGIVTAVIGQFGSANTLALQPDGHVLLGGSTREQASFDDFALARYDTEGTPDASFSGDGLAFYEHPTSLDEVRALAVRPDGDIIVAGTVGGSITDMMVLRLSPQGSLVGSFGQQGVATTHLHTGEVCNDMLLRPDGRIVLLGAMRLTLPDADLNIRQLLANGTPDSTFSDSGSFRLQEPGSVSVAESGRLLEDGRVLFGGKRYVQGQAGNALFLGQLLENGTWDPDYGTGGRLPLPISAPYVADLKDIAIGADGKTWIACDMTDTSTGIRSLAVLRAMPDGTIDENFGLDGTVYMPCPFGVDCRIEAISPQPDGKILAVGNSRVDTTASDMFIMRFLPELSPLGVARTNAPSFAVYPNPAVDQVVIERSREDVGNASVQLSDMLGRPVVLIKSVSGSIIHVPLPASIANGAYAMSITTAQGTTTRMLAVRH